MASFFSGNKKRKVLLLFVTLGVWYRSINRTTGEIEFVVP